MLFLVWSLIFGGFSEFRYNKDNEVYIFFLGGKWESYSDLIDEWNNIYVYDYVFKRGIGLWLFLDNNLRSIIRDSNGRKISFKKGAKCKIEVKQQDKKKTYVYNIPISIMAKGFSKIEGNNIIIADCNEEEFQQFAALKVSNGDQSPFYQRIEFISESTFFFSEENKIGIRNYNDIIVNAEFLFMTYPVNGFYFVAKELDDDFSNLSLYSLNDKSFHIEAIRKIKTSELIENAAFGGLKIECKDVESNLSNIILPKHDIFDGSFIRKVSQQESNYSCSRFKDIYWFANDYRMKEADYSEDYGDYDDHDYARDTWDAMTDGMYGDMPDGFDGDYAFLGY